MSHEHSHDAGRRALTIAFALIVALLAGEVVFGIIAGSLALLADAGHMLTDAAALGLALGAASARAAAGARAAGRTASGGSRSSPRRQRDHAARSSASGSSTRRSGG